MLLNTARTPARTDDEGNLLRLRDQDRTRWNQALIARGMLEMARSASGEEISEYHLQAAMSACHCRAADYQSTDWNQILSLYNRLLEFDNSPVVALNRAVALAEVNGPQAGLDAVLAIMDRQSLDDYYLFHAVLGEFKMRLNLQQEAAVHFKKALELAQIKSEQVLLQEKLDVCESVLAAAA